MSAPANTRSGLYLDVPRTASDVAFELRLSLLRVLSPDWKCAACKVFVDLPRLEIDHVDGRDWSVRGTSSLVRVRRYWSEFFAGVRLRAVCKTCNTADGNRRRSREENAA